MTVIKNLAFTDKNKLKNLNSFVESELDLSAFCPFPIDAIHHFLPFKFKFLNESFVAIENKKILGLVTVNKTSPKKVKITRLLLDENSVYVGKMLIDCVTTAYFSKGAESFYVVVNKENNNLTTMFKEGLGFKSYAKEITYKIDDKDLFLGLDDVNFDHIRKINKNDIKEVKALIDGSVNTFQKPYFSEEIHNLSSKNYVVFNKNDNKIYGLFEISKLNNEVFFLDFVLKQGYEAYYSDIIQFCKVELLKKKNAKALYVKLKSFYSNFKDLNEILSLEYKNFHESEILVKDFLVTIKQEYAYERMIFNDATPAF